MKHKKYFHIGFYFLGQPLGKELEPVFTKCSEDWIRYAENCWIIYTQHTAEELLKKLKPHLSDKDHILILEIVRDQQLSGWLPQWIWEWLYKSRS
jgi:hypothetical protein